MAWKYVQYNGETGKQRTVEGGGGGEASSFSELEDVDFSNLQNGQVPKYNSSTQKWENADESGGTVTDVQVNGESVVNQQGEAEITSYKEVTQAEYNALPISKETDGVLYCIKDVGGADSFPPLIYSDEEREIGVWRDGKPLYQKTIDTGSIPNSSSKSVNHNIANIDRVVDFYGTAQNSGGDNIPLQRADFSGWGVNVSVNRTRISLNAQYDLSAYTSSYITLQYTKTTDTAGSGTWNQQGGYAHHYSTTEHIIGTWIDGKPIYECVLLNTQPIGLVQGTWVKTEFDKGSIEKIIKCSLTNIAYLAFHSGLSAGFVDDKLAINSARSMNYDIGDCAIVLQYTKTTD